MWYCLMATADRQTASVQGMLKERNRAGGDRG